MTPFKILPGLPPYGPCASPFPENGRGSFSEGLVIQFFPCSENAWIGNFQRGRLGPDTVLEHPDECHIIIVARGEGYIINPETRKQITQLPYIRCAFAVTELGAVVLGDYFRFASLRANGFWWQSKRISWDGFRKIAVSGTTLTGESYSAPAQAWVPFSLDLTSGKCSGGAYPRWSNRGLWRAMRRVLSAFK
jgi:hypothetical protein